MSGNGFCSDIAEYFFRVVELVGASKNNQIQIDIPDFQVGMTIFYGIEIKKMLDKMSYFF